MTMATAIKERPILFSAPMVNAILAGKKTQTRREVKLPRWAAGREIEIDELGLPVVFDPSIETHGWIPCPYASLDIVATAKEQKPVWKNCSLWVRESWALRNDVDWATDEAKAKHYALYRASYNGNLEDEWHSVDRWRPSIHMPRCLSRINLEITGVRVERLNEISAEDAIAEGALRHAETDPAKLDRGEWEQCKHTALFCFKSLWNKINGDDSWERNPWVWVVSFKRLENT